MNIIKESAKYNDFESCSDNEQKKFLNALNFRCTAYGLPQAISIDNVRYDKDFDIWYIQYHSLRGTEWEWMYDSELLNDLAQVPDVFEPMEELLDTVSALREEFSGIVLRRKGNKAILSFRALSYTFILQSNKLIWGHRQWDCGDVVEYVDKTYSTHNQVEGLKAQLRSDFWFELEVLEVA